MQTARGEKWKWPLAQSVSPGLYWEVGASFRNSRNSVKKFGNSKKTRLHKRGSIDREDPRPTRQRSKELNLLKFSA